MRVLISGGFGFVGGRLAVHLAQAGHQVMLGSRKAGKVPPWLPQAVVAQLVWDEASALQDRCRGVDVVIQAAGMNAQDCTVDPVAALAFNGVATARLVAAAGRAGVQRFVYLSTAHVYANPLEGIITEETCPRNLHPYATSHLAGEHAVLSANHRGEIQGVVLRLSNAFGAPTHKDANCWMLLVNDLCRQAVETRKLVLHTSGFQERDFVSLTDVCRVTEQLAMGGERVSSRGVFNVGAGASQTVLQMARSIQQRCAQVLGFEPDLEHPVGVVNQPDPTLIFRTVRLANAGICVANDNTAEIDALLHFCRSSFRQSQRQGA